MTASGADPEVVLDLARQDLASNRLAAAQTKCLQVLGTHRHHAGALGLLGRVLYSLGHFVEAVRVFNSLTVTEPGVAEHWQNLGTSLRPTKQYGQAIAAFDQALRLAPPSAALLYNLGILQMERCDYNAAYLSLRDAATLAPRDATVRWGFAQCCSDLINLEEASAALRGWQTFDGLTVELTVRIVFILVMLGEKREAESAIAGLVANPPRNGSAAVGVAAILERLHRLDESRAIIERLDSEDRSLDADPEKLKLAAVLADRAGKYETACALLTSALANQKNPLGRHHLLFPLAKVQDALGRHQEAYDTAVQAHLSQVAYCDTVFGQSPARSRILWRIEQACESSDVNTWDRGWPRTEDSPIFIVGFPRSGTTLLEQVLDAHPQLKSMDEQPFLTRTLDKVTELGIRYPDELGKLTAADLQEIRGGYWADVEKKVRLLSGERLVDKNPLNMTVLPMIQRLFPNSPIIFSIRHPCDVLLSCFLQDFRAPELALLCRDLATMADAYSRIFGYWYVQQGLLCPLSYELFYERLTNNFDGEVRKLAVFLQLPWHDAMLAPGEHALSKGFISTPSYTQVLEPVSNKSVGRWQNYKSQFAPHLPVLTPWIERWGYSSL